MKYITVAYDKDGNLRIYLNMHRRMYCTEVLKMFQVSIYIDLIISSILTFTDPLTIAQWEDAEGQSLPKTPRKAVGVTHNITKVTVCEFKVGNSLEIPSIKGQIIEQGPRSIVTSAFIVTTSKLFLTNLEGLLAEQDAMYESHLQLYREGRNV